MNPDKVLFGFKPSDADPTPTDCEPLTESEKNAIRAAFWLTLHYRPATRKTYWKCEHLQWLDLHLAMNWGRGLCWMTRRERASIVTHYARESGIKVRVSPKAIDARARKLGLPFKRPRGPRPSNFGHSHDS